MSFRAQRPVCRQAEKSFDYYFHYLNEIKIKSYFRKK